MAERLGDAVASALAVLRERFDSDPARQAREAERAAQISEAAPTGPTEADLEAARVPRRNWAWLLDESLRVETYALQTLREFTGHELLVLTGAKDSGRTGAGSWWVSQGGLFVHAEHLLEFWFRSRDQLYTARRLFIDDLGQEGGSVDQQALVREAVDCLTKVRCAELRETVVATNHVSKSFAAYLGDRWARVRDRLIEHGPRYPDNDKGFCACPVEGLRSADRRQKVMSSRNAVTPRNDGGPVGR